MVVLLLLVIPEISAERPASVGFKRLGYWPFRL
nr:MAG TPA: hypothetical protein [Caudoviricetes sp.]